MIRAFEMIVLGYFLALHSAHLLSTLSAFFGLAAQRLRSGPRDPRDPFPDAAGRPISILLPVRNAEATVVEALRSLLLLGYAEFEIILVNDGSTDATLERLRRAFALFPAPLDFDQRLPTRPIRRVFLSLDHPNLTVVDKEPGGKGDALNAGIDASSFALLCTLDLASRPEPEALRRAVRVFTDDPRVVAAGGIIRPSAEAAAGGGPAPDGHAPRHPLLLCQAQEYVRAVFGGRPPPTELYGLALAFAAFGLWRKDAAVRVGGFACDLGCEELELLLRLRRLGVDEGRQTRVVLVPEAVCRTRLSADWRSLVRRRCRWQRGLWRSLWRHRRMLLNPRYGNVGTVSLPFAAAFEALGPILELAGYIVVLALLVVDRLSPGAAPLFLVIAVLYGMVPSLLAVDLDHLLFRPYPRTRDLARMMLGAVLEHLGYRQCLAAVRSWGALGVVFRRRGRDAASRFGSFLTNP